MALRGRCARTVHRARLLAAAWRLHGAAQALARGDSLSAVSDALRRRVPTPDADPDAAAWAATWAGRLGRRLLGRLDTCLVRALVTGRLIRSDAAATLCLGVHRPLPDADLLDAHAWVTAGGAELGLDGGRAARFETVLTYPLADGDSPESSILSSGLRT